MAKQFRFLTDAVEVKANWIPVPAIPAFTGNRVSLADVPKLYHVNTGSDGKQYAMVSMHIISKLVPNSDVGHFRTFPKSCQMRHPRVL